MPKTPDYFVGKTIIITGAASGIGRAAAMIFAREGANVVCADINGNGAKETAEQIVAQGGKAIALPTDVTSRRQVNDMVHRAVETFGTVQFQFNSAGAALRRSKFLDIDDALFESTFALNVNGTLYCMQAILPHMLENGHGVIVNMASMAHRRGGPGSSVHYAAAQTPPELMQRFLDDVPMKRFGEPEEIGELVLFMCSDACSFMTADTVYVNGGGGWR